MIVKYLVLQMLKIPEFLKILLFFFYLQLCTYVLPFFKVASNILGRFFILFSSSSFHLSLSSSKDIWWKSKSIDLFTWIQKVAMGFLECNYDLQFNLEQILMIFFNLEADIDDFFLILVGTKSAFGRIVQTQSWWKRNRIQNCGNRTGWIVITGRQNQRSTYHAKISEFYGIQN